MVSGAAQDISDQSSELLQHAGLPRKQGNVLLIKHAALPWPAGDCLERNEASFDRAVHLSLGAGTERFTGLSCRSAELPFTEACFRLVILWHVLAEGAEAELQEAQRVLAVGGDLLILGLQQGVPGKSGWQQPDLPQLRRRQLLGRLQSTGMEVVSVLGSGLPVNRNWVMRRSGLSGALLPFARLVLIRARHANGDALSPLRLQDFRSGVARPTEAASLFRQ